ncbi:MAG: hypothetical protein NVSMB27_19070 [Ktedonobacteraceae bacterium]
MYTDPSRNDIIFSFSCDVVGGKVMLSEEADAIKYFPIDQLPERTHLHHVIRIKDALDEAQQVQLKVLPTLASNEFGKRDEF